MDAAPGVARGGVNRSRFLGRRASVPQCAGMSLELFAPAAGGGYVSGAVLELTVVFAWS